MPPMFVKKKVTMVTGDDPASSEDRYPRFNHRHVILAYKSTPVRKGNVIFMYCACLRSLPLHPVIPHPHASLSAFPPPAPLSSYLLTRI